MEDTVDKFDLRKHVQTSVECVGAKWHNDKGKWEIQLKDLKTGIEYSRFSLVFVSAVGAISFPRDVVFKGMQSFKVLAECPIIVVSLFQAHRPCVHKNVKLFVPRIKEMLLLQAGPQEEAHRLAKAKGEVFTGVSPNIKNRVAFGEFITAQVKVSSKTGQV